MTATLITCRLNGTRLDVVAEIDGQRCQFTCKPEHADPSVGLPEGWEPIDYPEDHEDAIFALADTLMPPSTEWYAPVKADTYEEAGMLR